MGFTMNEGRNNQEEELKRLHTLVSQLEGKVKVKEMQLMELRKQLSSLKELQEELKESRRMTKSLMSQLSYARTAPPF